MVTKGRYQTKENKTTVPFARFSIVDTEGTTQGQRFIATTDTERKADHVASALNFNYRPRDYGFKLVD